MPRTALTPISLPEAYALAPSALTYAAGDVANGNDVPHTGREIVICRNTDGTPNTFTVQSKALRNREGDCTITVPGNGSVITQNFPTAGWQQADGKLWIDVDDATLEIAVVKLP